MARLLPFVADDARSLELLDCHLRLSRPVRAYQAHMLSRVELAGLEEELATGRDGDDDVGGERLGLVLGDPRCLTELGGYEVGLVPARVPQEDLSLARDEGPRDRTPVHTAADDRRGRDGRARQRLRGEDGCRPGPESGDGPHVDQRPQLSRVSIREEDDTRDRREAAVRVPRERGHPLEHRMARA